MKKLAAVAALTVTLAGFAAPAHAAYVCRLNPYGDNFLSLRTGPGSRFDEIDRLGPNTQLTVLRQSGGWLYVRTESGDTGWVFSRYVCG